jgi:hypothetical protein
MYQDLSNSKGGKNGSWFDFKFSFNNTEEKILKISEKEEKKTVVQLYPTQTFVIDYLNKRGISSSTAQKCNFTLF